MVDPIIMSIDIVFFVILMFVWRVQVKRLRKQVEEAEAKAATHYRVRHDWFHRAHVAEGKLITLGNRLQELLAERKKIGTLPPNTTTPELAPYLLSLTFTINRTTMVTALHRGGRWASTQAVTPHFYLFRDGFLVSAAANLGDNT
jgi:hypothetical protein